MKKASVALLAALSAVCWLTDWPVSHPVAFCLGVCLPAALVQPPASALLLAKGWAACYAVALALGQTLTSWRPAAWAAMFALLFVGPAGVDVTRAEDTEEILRGRRRDAAALALLAAVAGSYVGCFVAPLDWDRAWQLFPAPSLRLALPLALLAHLVAPHLH